MWKWLIGAAIAALGAMVVIGLCVKEVSKDAGYFEKTRHR